MGTIKNKNGRDLPTMLKRSRRDGNNTWKNHMKKDLNEPGYYDGTVSHPEPDILECKVNWALRNTAINKAAAAAAAKSLQSCPALCHPTDGSPPGSSVHGILQARTLEWVAISSSNA